MSRRPWTDDEKDFMRENYPHMTNPEIAEALGRTVAAVARRGNQMGLSKTAETRARVNSRNSSKPRRVSPGSKRTQFSRGITPHNLLPIGAERWSHNGYLVRKIRDTGEWCERWAPVHKLLWEEAHGPIPEGHVVAFRDGDKTNVVLENLELRTKKDHMLRYSVWNYPRPLAEAMRMLGQHRRRIREKEEQKA